MKREAIEADMKLTIMIDCVCGVRFRVESRNPAPLVRKHNEQSKFHKEWRKKMGIDSGIR